MPGSQLPLLHHCPQTPALSAKVLVRGAGSQLSKLEAAPFSLPPSLADSPKTWASISEPWPFVDDSHLCSEGTLCSPSPTSPHVCPLPWHTWIWPHLRLFHVQSHKFKYSASSRQPLMSTPQFLSAPRSPLGLYFPSLHQPSPRFTSLIVQLTFHLCNNEIGNTFLFLRCELLYLFIEYNST